DIPSSQTTRDTGPLARTPHCRATMGRDSKNAWRNSDGPARQSIGCLGPTDRTAVCSRGSLWFRRRWCARVQRAGRDLLGRLHFHRSNRWSVTSGCVVESWRYQLSSTSESISEVELNFHVVSKCYSATLATRRPVTSPRLRRSTP